MYSAFKIALFCILYHFRFVLLILPVAVCFFVPELWNEILLKLRGGFHD